jgi:hypothetical protein
MCKQQCCKSISGFYLDQTNVQNLLIAADMIQLKEASCGRDPAQRGKLTNLNRLGFIGVSSSAANLYQDSTWTRPMCKICSLPRT